MRAPQLPGVPLRRRVPGTARSGHGARPEEWRAYLYVKTNAAGWVTETWFHRNGCRRYLTLERHTVTNEIRGARRSLRPSDVRPGVARDAVDARPATRPGHARRSAAGRGDRPPGPARRSPSRATTTPVWPATRSARPSLAAGVRVMSRSFKYHRPRGVMTATFLDPGCIVQVGDEPNVRGSHRRLAAGMEVTAQNVWPSLKVDVKVANQAVGRFLDQRLLLQDLHQAAAAVARVPEGAGPLRHRRSGRCRQRARLLRQALRPRRRLRGGRWPGGHGGGRRRRPRRRVGDARGGGARPRRAPALRVGSRPRRAGRPAGARWPRSTTSRCSSTRWSPAATTTTGSPSSSAGCGAWRSG